MSKKLLVWGGGIFALFFVTQNILAYDQPNTHPALTKAAGDFYNLSFSKNKISEEEIKLLMKGAYDEDQPPRWLNHSYDPVHNKAWVGYRTSKVWAMNSSAQQVNRGLYAVMPVFEEKIENENDFYDFSYERALLDYAKGNRNRAFEALGHVMHLLEDANVPEHTRLDIHLPWHGTESPYEKTMAKWNPSNINVAQKLYQQREKPILLSSLDKYFDEIAGYSNGYFFSEDTIYIKRYELPKKVSEKNFIDNGKTYKFAIGLDKDGSNFFLFRMNPVSSWRNVVTETKFTLNSNVVLDDYWSRLSKDFVLHGAGVIKLFLEQGEEVKKEYERRLSLKKENQKGFLGSIFDFGKNSAKINGINLVQAVLGENEDKGTAADNIGLVNFRKGNVGIGTSDVGVTTTTTTPPRSDLFKDPRSDLKKEETTTTTVVTTTTTTLKKLEDSPQEVVTSYSGGGSGGGSWTSETSTTTTTTTTSTTTTTLAPTPSSTPTPETALGKVVINEIAWMGTASSSNDEWLELYNTSSKSNDISGWTLKALDGTPNVKLASKSIDPFGFYLLERTNDNTISDISADQTYSGDLSNSGEVLELRDKSGNLQDVVSKSNSGGWYAGKNEKVGASWQRFSMERKDPLKSGKDATNWGINNGITKNGKDAGGNLINGTPRAKNSLFSGQKPSKINNFAISSASGNKINFSWSAPSDADTLPAGLQYDLRYATKSFDSSADWDLAKKAISLPAVDSFGKTASYSLTIDNFNKQYFFTIKTKDSDGNISDISNQVSYTLPSAISDSGWPMSGFNETHSLKTGFLGPFASTAKTKWGIQLLSSPPVYFSQPVLAPNGTIYYGASNGTTMAQLRATSPSGADSWQYGAISGATIGTPVALSDNSMLFGYTNIAADFVKLDANGNAKFSIAIGTINSVTVDKDGVTYFTTSADKLYAIAPDGTQKWQIQKDGMGGFTPIVYQDKIYITARLSGVPVFYAFDAKDGSFLWSKGMSTNSPSCCGVSDISYDSANDFLYAGADQYILKVDRNGSVLDQFLADRQGGFGRTTTMVSQDTANLVFGVDFSASNPASGSAVYAVNKATKEKNWSYTVNSKVNKQIAIDSSGNSYFSTQNGWVYSLSQTGGLNWKIDLSGTTSAYPVIGQGVLYQAMDGGRIVKISE